MAADRAQVWFREVIAGLRQAWRPGLSWPEVIELRERLQSSLDAIVDARRAAAGKVPPACSRCGGQMRPVITVRAVLLALGRFGVEKDQTVRELDRGWKEHRALHGLNMLGQKAGANEANEAHVHATSATEA